MDKKAIFGVIVAIVVILGGIYWYSSASAPADGGAGNEVAGASSEEKIAFAQSISEEGATFYGAFWCPHCNEQKALFGEEAMEEIDYVECSTPDGNSQTQVCREANIQSYPTWEFADGSRVTGVQSLEALSEQTGVPAPGAREEANATSTGNATSSEEEATTTTNTEATTTADIELQTQN